MGRTKRERERERERDLEEWKKYRIIKERKEGQYLFLFPIYLGIHVSLPLLSAAIVYLVVWDNLSFRLLSHFSCHFVVVVTGEVLK